MVNLEWFRSFRAVYKSKSLSKASALLMISQPTVSQHIAALESRMGQKLFVRKSKGVIETEEGKLLNTLVSAIIEQLEAVEVQISKPDSEIKRIFKIGVSEHLYKSLFCNCIQAIGEYVHVTFGTKDELKALTENGKIHAAVVTEKIETFDLICDHLYPQNLVLAASNDINLATYEKAYRESESAAEAWLNQQLWYAHDANCSFIKNYWLLALSKKRPAIIPHYIIPNEHEVLYQLSKNSGVCICSDSTVASFESARKLQSTNIAKIHWRDIYLISNKKLYDRERTHSLIEQLNIMHRSH